jgi:hypothetical protein
MHVSSTCGAEPMESLKDRKVVPGGGTQRAARQVDAGIGSQRLARSAPEGAEKDQENVRSRRLGKALIAL